MDAAHATRVRARSSRSAPARRHAAHRAPHVTGSTTDADMHGALELSSGRATRARPASSACCTTPCRNAGFAAASFWAPVPHYVATPPNPGAIVALLHGVGRAVDLAVDTRELGVAAEAWEARVDAAVAEDDDMRAYVQSLEEQYDERVDRPTTSTRRGDPRAATRSPRRSRSTSASRASSSPSRASGRRTPRRARARARSRGRGSPGRPARRCRGTSWRSPRTGAAG